MKFKKVFSDTLSHCYAVLHLKNEADDFLVIASEEDQPCYAYDLNHSLTRTTVWDSVGGTMTMVQIPNTTDFLATQRFYPGFNAAGCILVKEEFDGSGWNQKIIGDFPYVHRFDLIPKGPHTYWFIGCSIANSKLNFDDWSDPGKNWVGEYNDITDKVTKLHALETRLTKNHGYYRMKGQPYSFITAVEGIFKLHYPSEEKDWQLEQVSDVETSDIATCDINSDDDLEYLTIEGFHGPYLSVLDDKFQTLIHTEPQTPFGHAIWGGQIKGVPLFIFGYREGKRDLLSLTVNEGQLVERPIDKNVGPSNVLVYQKNNQDFIFSANRETSEVAIYQIFSD